MSAQQEVTAERSAPVVTLAFVGSRTETEG